MSPKAAARIAGIAALLLLLAPLQMLALKTGWRLAARLPMRFHQIALALIGVRLVQRGRPAAVRPHLVVSNHVSWLDIPVLAAAAPLSFVAKSEVGGWPGVGWMARMQRTVFVQRERRHRTGETAGVMGERLRAGDTLVLFAEGTTGSGLHVLPFRSALLGAAHAALGPDGTAWVQPVALHYGRRDGLPLTRRGLPHVAWTGDVGLAPHLIGVLAGGPIEVEVRWGEPVAVTAATDRKALTRLLEEEVRRLRRQTAVIPDGAADPGSQAE